MPVKVPLKLPAIDTLLNENIFVISDERAKHQDIRPLKIAVLNLMPTKIVTETQILRLLSNTAIQVDVSFIRTETYESKNTSAEHLENFYKPISQIYNEKFDGLVITGAPVEHLDFEEVAYWKEISDLLDWAKKNVWSTLHICWGAQAGLYKHFGIQKNKLKQKVFGLYYHKALDLTDPLLRGFDEVYLAPHSRHTEIKLSDIKKIKNLKILSTSDKAGLYIVATMDRRMVFVTGHPEYDKFTLKTEYDRDIQKGLDINIPENYFPNNNPLEEPMMNWRSHAHMLYSNWLNYYVYEETPFDLESLP